MIRVVSTFCIGLMGFTCIANYHVSEQTRIARQELTRTEKEIKAETRDISVLELQWQKVANPEVIQKLAEAQLGMQNAPSVQLASVHDLPRRGDMLNNEDVHSANAEVEATPTPVVKAAMRSGM
jgi:cell division protein FtsL